MPDVATTARLQVTRDVLVVQTYVVPGPDRLTTSHYEIHVATDERTAPRTVLITRRVELYVQAAAVEGTADRFDASWHRAKQGSKSCQVLDSLELVA